AIIYTGGSYNFIGAYGSTPCYGQRNGCRTGGTIYTGYRKIDIRRFVQRTKNNGGQGGDTTIGIPYLRGVCSRRNPVKFRIVGNESGPNTIFVGTYTST